MFNQMYQEQLVLVTDANILTFVDMKNENEKILPIKLAFQYLRSKGIVHTQQDVADKLSVSKENISRLMNGNERYHTPSYLSRFNKAFDNIFNEDWLLSGEGEMLKTSPERETINESHLPTNIEKKGVPYFEDIVASCSILSMNMDAPETPTFYIDYEHFNDCNAYIPVVGDSMYPLYCAGEIVAVKQIFNFDVIQWGEAYLVITNGNANDLRTIKQIHYCEDKSKIILRASNPNFKGDTEINKNDIRSLFIIKGKIKRNQL